MALIPAGAGAKPIESTVEAGVFATIDQRSTLIYYFGGQVGAQHLTFGCMEDRRVVLFRVEGGGAQKRVAATDTKLFGSFLAPLEKPPSAIPGHYYVKVKPRIRKTKRRGKGSKRQKLNCLAVRTPAFLVQVPSGLLTAPSPLERPTPGVRPTA
jgi:hypothetical protein